MMQLLDALPEGFWAGVYCGAPAWIALTLFAMWLILGGEDGPRRTHPRPSQPPAPPAVVVRPTPSIPLIINGEHAFDCICPRCKHDRQEVQRTSWRAEVKAWRRHDGGLPPNIPLYPQGKEVADALGALVPIYIRVEDDVAHSHLQ